MYKKETESLKIRPAFHVDEQLKAAARKAAEAFKQEEKDLETFNEEKYNKCEENFQRSGF